MENKKPTVAAIGSRLSGTHTQAMLLAKLREQGVVVEQPDVSSIKTLEEIAKSKRPEDDRTQESLVQRMFSMTLEEFEMVVEQIRRKESRLSSDTRRRVMKFYEEILPKYPRG